MYLKTAALLALLCTVAPAVGQIIPKDAGEPAEVHKARGDFAKKLQGGVMPKGKGWKPVLDSARRFQLMLPEKWKVTTAAEGEAVILAVPPATGKEATAQLLVSVIAPRDADPLEIDENFALNYADSLAEDPQFKRLKYQPTDSGHLLMRGMKFAVAGGKMILESGSGKRPKTGETFQQQQLVYIAVDRLVVLQFTAPAADFPRYADDLAKVFTSYQNIRLPSLD